MEPTPDQQSLHAFVEGHVQGVGFRYYVKETAERLALTGWVRNRLDGSVEVMAQGDRAHLQNLLDSIQIGPSRSIVTHVQADWGTPENHYSQFSFLPTE